jgi:hypothetical protein
MMPFEAIRQVSDRAGDTAANRLNHMRYGSKPCLLLLERLFPKLDRAPNSGGHYSRGGS